MSLIDAVTSGGFPLITWMLWGGLAIFFCGLYAGVYIWMRRPRFGEGEGPATPGLSDLTVSDAAGQPEGKGPLSEEAAGQRTTA
jgi:hypothetical protein